MKIVGASRWICHDNLYRLDRVRLRPRDMGSERQSGRASSQMEKLSTVGKFHCVLPDIARHAMRADPRRGSKMMLKMPADGMRLPVQKGVRHVPDWQLGED